MVDPGNQRLSSSTRSTRSTQSHNTDQRSNKRRSSSTNSQRSSGHLENNDLMEKLMPNIKELDDACHEFDNRHYTRAEEMFRKIGDAKALFNVGQIHLLLKEFDEAIQAFTEAIERDQYLAIAYYQRGVTFYITGKWDKAIQDFNEAYKKVNRAENTLENDIMITYREIGLDYTLYGCEISFNLGLSRLKMDRRNSGLADLYRAKREWESIRNNGHKFERHGRIENAYRNTSWNEYKLFKAPFNRIFRPRISECTLSDPEAVPLEITDDKARPGTILRSKVKSIRIGSWIPWMNTGNSGSHNSGSSTSSGSSHGSSARFISRPIPTASLSEPHIRSKSVTDRVLRPSQSSNSLRVENIEPCVRASSLHTSILRRPPPRVTNNAGRKSLTLVDNILPVAPITEDTQREFTHSPKMVAQADAHSSILMQYMLNDLVGSTDNAGKYSSLGLAPWESKNGESTASGGIKIKIHHNDTRIIRAKDNITYEDLVQKIMEKFKLKARPDLKYKDDEGDEIGLIEDEDLDMARYQKRNKERLEIWIK